MKRLALRKPITRRFCRDTSGQAQVEFVLTILFVLLLIFGIFELIMLVYTYNVLADSAKEGVRYAIVHGSASAMPSTGSGCSTTAPTDVMNVVTNYAQLSFHNITGMTVTVCYPDGSSTSASDPPNAAPNRVSVTIDYPYKPLLGLGWPTVTVQAAAEGRIAF